jgi:hypothetical protein
MVCKIVFESSIISTGLIPGSKPQAGLSADVEDGDDEGEEGGDRGGGKDACVCRLTLSMTDMHLSI